MMAGAVALHFPTRDDSSLRDMSFKVNIFWHKDIRDSTFFIGWENVIFSLSTIIPRNYIFLWGISTDFSMLMGRPK